MNKRQKLVQQAFLDSEEVVISRLKKVYDKSFDDITKKTKELQDQINTLDALANLTDDANEKARLLSMQQSKIYQKQYQDALKKQIGSILDNMQVEEFKTVSEYLQQCYEDGFIGTMFDLQGQGIPLCFPLDQESMVRAVQTDSKISQGLYTRLGEDVTLLKRKITAQVSRGISTGMSHAQVAQQLAAYTNIGFNNAVRIARTEGHRIQVQSAMDACYKAKDAGADIVKQWDASLDKKTRESHQHVDGEIRELDEPFSNGLKFPGDPDGGAAEVVNCRCALLQRAKWALDADELETLKERAAYYELDKADTFKDYKKKYLKAAEAEQKPVQKEKEIPKNENDDKIKLTMDSFSSAFTAKKEAKNTQKFIDYVNSVDGADPAVLKLYNSIGKLENLEANGIKFTISHGKNHAIRESYNIMSGKYVEIKLTIPKLSGDNIAGQMQTTLHENMHLIDLLLKDDPTSAGTFFTASNKKMQELFKKTDINIGDDIDSLFDDFEKEYDEIRKKYQKQYDKGYEEIKEKYFPNGMWGVGADYSGYKKAASKLKKEIEEARDYDSRNIMGGGVNNLQDIYDALSGGSCRDSGLVKYGHGSQYYRSTNARINETIANYAALSVTRPDLVEMLRKDKPELVAALEEVVQEMGKKVDDLD